jgi:hypothetical protein
METKEIISSIYDVLKKPVEHWSLSKKYFHDFYKNNICSTEEGWTKENCEIILQTIATYVKGEWSGFTQTLLDKFSNNPEITKIIQKLIAIVKLCDTNAYQQDNAMPTVCKSMILQSDFYEKILKWKLESRKPNLFEDILTSKNFSPLLKNIFLCLYDPQNYVFMVSPKHREAFMRAFIDQNMQFDSNDPQIACIKSNEQIKGLFLNFLREEPELLKNLTEASLDEHFFTRVISHVMYDSVIRSEWHIKKGKDDYLIFSIKEDSPWEDEREASYQYGVTVPNYKRVSPGVNFLLYEKNVGFIGYGVIGEIKHEKSEMGVTEKYRAYYSGFERLDPPVQIDEEIKVEIESIPGFNPQHAIKRINKDIFDMVTKKGPRFWK